MSGDRADPTVILIHDGVLESWARDAFTFGMLLLLPWFNHTYAGGSGWINAAIAFAWFVTVLSRASGLRKRWSMTPREARRLLDAKFPEA